MAALAITNADLFGDLRARNQEAELLNRIAAKVGSSLESSTIAAATIHELAALMPLTRPASRWVSREAVGRDLLDCFLLERVWEVGEEAAPPTLRDALLRESVVAVTWSKRIPPVAGSRLEGMRSLLVIGVWIDDGLSGALMLVSAERDAFAEADRHLLGRVGGQLALSFKNARLYETVKTMHVANLKALISALNARDTYAVGHAARVAAYMLLLGRELGWPDERLPQIVEASFLHDVGRIGVADSVLFKPGRLNDAETASSTIPSPAPRSSVPCSTTTSCSPCATITSAGTAAATPTGSPTRRSPSWRELSASWTRTTPCPSSVRTTRPSATPSASRSSGAVAASSSTRDGERLHARARRLDERRSKARAAAARRPRASTPPRWSPCRPSGTSDGLSTASWPPRFVRSETPTLTALSDKHGPRA